MKRLVWVASAKADFLEFPDEAQDVMGYALHLAQTGGKHPTAKVLRGFGSAGVVEAIDDFDSDIYRTVYTVAFADAVYVLHAFKKKSKSGRATPRPDLEVIQRRLRAVRDQHARKEGTR